LFSKFIAHLLAASLQGAQKGLELEQGGNVTYYDHSEGSGLENSPEYGKNKHLKWREKPGLNKE
jgi:hypothetical protein